MTLILKSSGFCHAGPERGFNEDAILEATPYGTWLVADGMGGHSSGDVASHLVCQQMTELLYTFNEQTFDEVTSLFLQCFQQINRKILNFSREHLNGQTMGSTVVALFSDGVQFSVFWAGDSRCYLYRQGSLTKLTRDHSKVNQLVEAGLMSEKEAENHPLSHIITRALGAQSLVEVDIFQGNLYEGDRFLLCSDGVTGVLEHQDLLANLQLFDIQAITQTVFEECMRRQATDNISCILVEAGDFNSPYSQTNYDDLSKTREIPNTQ